MSTITTSASAPHRTIVLRALFFLFWIAPVPGSGQGLGIEEGFPWTAGSTDTASSDYLPTAFDGPAGSHGFLRTNAEGNFVFEDGSPIRFMGMLIQGSACFPDSAAAIVTARRLRKLGVNLVRFRYFDYSSGTTSTFLDPASGYRTINPEQMARFDRFIHQLKLHGIYTMLPLWSIRRLRAEDGLSADQLDSMYTYGMYHLYPEGRAAHKHIARLLLDHVNPYTGTSYGNEPAIAALEIMHRGSLTRFYRGGQTEYRPGQSGFSWTHSRRLDTLYDAWLRSKYGSTSALAEAWNVETPSQGYPNRMKEGGFEGAFDEEWDFGSNNGVSILPLLTSNDSVPEGSSALSIRTRDPATIYSAYMRQLVGLEYGKTYRLTFRAKSGDPDGRNMYISFVATAGGLSPGISRTLSIPPYWSNQEFDLTISVNNTAPFYIYFYCGDGEGDLFLDDIQLHEIPPTGLLPGERIEDVSVARIAWASEFNLRMSRQRIVDQSEFYLNMDRDYFREIGRFVRDTLHAAQPVTGSEYSSAGLLLDVAAQDGMDFGMASTGFDYIRNSGGNFWLANNSPLSSSYPVAAYTTAFNAREGQAFITSHSQPFPSRYQAESMAQIPAYTLLQDWDGFIWDYYADTRFDTATLHVDSLNWYPAKNDPAVTLLIPAVSQILRNGLLSKANTTIRLRHTREQLLEGSRMNNFWGSYGLPGRMTGAGPAISRIVIDSLYATDFTQSNDYGFELQNAGEILSDTREIYFEYGRRGFTVNSPFVQGASGRLERPGGLKLDLMNIDIYSTNETATLLWVPLDPARPLDEPGRSLLTIVTRAEPTGWKWKDSTTYTEWGTGPMLLDPARLQLEFKPKSAVDEVLVTPLNAIGQPAGEPMVATRTGKLFRLTIDQKETHAVWYGVEMISTGTDVGDETVATDGIRVQAIPNVVGDRGEIFLQMPSTEHDVRVDLYDALGRLVRRLHNGSLEAGEHRIDFETGDLSAGAYFVKARIGSNATVLEEVRILR